MVRAKRCSVSLFKKLIDNLTDLTSARDPKDAYIFSLGRIYGSTLIYPV